MKNVTMQGARGRAARRRSGEARETAGRRRGAALAAVMLTGLVFVLLGAAPAPAIIQDEDASPSYAFILNGPGDGDDAARDAVMTSTATWVSGQVTNAAGNLDAAVVRIPTRGTPSPFKRYDGPAHGADTAEHLAVRGSYVYTAGMSYNAAGDRDLVVCRWSSTGAFKWARRFAAKQGSDDFARDVAIDAKGNVIVAGLTQTPEPTDLVVIKYSPSGKKLWTWRFDGKAHGNDNPSEMLVDGAGNVYVTGQTMKATTTAAYTVKLSPAGKKLWSRTFGSGGGGNALAPAPGKGVYVGGATYLSGENMNAFLVKYSPAGAVKTFAKGSGDGGDVAQSILDVAVAADGSIVGVGWSGLVPDIDRYWIRWKADGTVVTQKSQTTAELDMIVGVATDVFGGIIMTGSWDGPATVPQILTTRTSLYSGAQWGYAFGSGFGDRSVEAIAAKGTGVTVAGKEENLGSGDDWFVHIWTY